MILASTNDLSEIVELKFDHVFFTGKTNRSKFEITYDHY